MVLFDYVFLLIFVVKLNECLIPLNGAKRNETMCERMVRKSYFDMDLVVGDPWRILYTWNMSLNEKCVDITFANATNKSDVCLSSTLLGNTIVAYHLQNPESFSLVFMVGDSRGHYVNLNTHNDIHGIDAEVINEVWNDMYEYLEEQPLWAGATLHMTMGPTRYELLMFAQPGSAGAFTAVPNIVKKASMAPPRHSVPLLTFYLTLVDKGRFLIMIDCRIGVGSLSERSKSFESSKKDVMALVAELDLGTGHPACTEQEKEFLQDHLD